MRISRLCFLITPSCCWLIGEPLNHALPLFRSGHPTSLAK
jgi:hypothetical protein